MQTVLFRPLEFNVIWRKIDWQTQADVSADSTALNSRPKPMMSARSTHHTSVRLQNVQRLPESLKTALSLSLWFHFTDFMKQRESHERNVWSGHFAWRSNERYRRPLTSTQTLTLSSLWLSVWKCSRGVVIEKVTGERNDIFTQYFDASQPRCAFSVLCFFDHLCSFSPFSHDPPAHSAAKGVLASN